MIPNTQEAEYPYSVKLEISNGQAISMQIVFLTVPSGKPSSM